MFSLEDRVQLDRLFSSRAIQGTAINVSQFRREWRETFRQSQHLQNGSFSTFVQGESAGLLDVASDKYPPHGRDQDLLPAVERYVHLGARRVDEGVHRDALNIHALNIVGGAAIAPRLKAGKQDDRSRFERQTFG